MRIFFDANVLISAFITRKGACASLFSLVTDNTSYSLVSSRVVLTEIKKVLTEKFRFTPQKVDRLLRIMEMHEIAPVPQNPSSLPIRDPDDALVLASALEAKADILVTGDKDLLVLGDQAGIKIVDPRTLWNMLEKK
ncbi:MAG: putative toxin-antitoxin system toxin component, PIN family [Nitrospinae bacterium]|nr:putative toxin-antitoxin system toxin component, PIN family [Nitrospinota bacterium]